MTDGGSYGDICSPARSKCLFPLNFWFSALAFRFLYACLAARELEMLGNYGLLAPQKLFCTTYSLLKIEHVYKNYQSKN